jgi:hypothetical protein
MKMSGISIAILLTMTGWIASCSSEKAQPPGIDLSSIQQTPATGENCEIDAVKMCQAEGPSTTASSQPAAIPMASSYGPSNVPESIEFQIPAGQAIKLMCYYDAQHGGVYRADATPEAAFSGSSVEYMKKQGFCTNK